MDTVLKKVKEYVRKYHMITAGDTVVAGVSGGADSVCLLFVLQEICKEIPFRLFVVHINHMIRREASLDARYVEDLCQQMEIPFYLYERDVKEIAATGGISEEEAGRQVRYAAFWEVLEKEAPQEVKEGKAKIAVAHNQNDRAETMLFQLFRGSGIKGLIGIRPVRDCIIRPLLCLQREEIEGFLQEKSIKYCIDFTNEEDTYTRNKIRHHILPTAVQQVCSSTVEHMASTADILLEAEDFLKAEEGAAFAACVKAESGQMIIEAAEFGKIHPYLQKQILFSVLEALACSRKDIGAVHIRDILALFEKEGNREICLPYGIRAERQYQQVIFRKAEGKEGCISHDREAIDNAAYPVGELSCVQAVTQVQVPKLGILEFTWMEQSPEDFQIPEENQYTKWFDYDKIKQSLEVRTRRTGDYLTINDRSDHQSIKKYMIQEKIPEKHRNEIWLLADGSHVLWVIGHRISAEYKISRNTKHVLKVQLRGGH